jgi:hypothetical protein
MTHVIFQVIQEEDTEDKNDDQMFRNLESCADALA